MEEGARRDDEGVGGGGGGGECAQGRRDGVGLLPFLFLETGDAAGEKITDLELPAFN